VTAALRWVDVGTSGTSQTVRYLYTASGTTFNILTVMTMKSTISWNSRSTFLRNVDKLIPSDTVSHPRR
jgi:hypothetical protein